ncbi:Eukaryotic translation initiation factor 3 subunit A, partial [Frankliniella fusca]
MGAGGPYAVMGAMVVLASMPMPMGAIMPNFLSSCTSRKPSTRDMVGSAPPRQSFTMDDSSSSPDRIFRGFPSRSPAPPPNTWLSVTSSAETPLTAADASSHEHASSARGVARRQDRVDEEGMA